MLKKILNELRCIVSVLWRIYETLKEQELTLLELKARLEPRKADGSGVQAEAGGKDPDAWMHAGIANILGYQPGQRSKEGEE